MEPKVSDCVERNFINAKLFAPVTFDLYYLFCQRGLGEGFYALLADSLHKFEAERPTEIECD